MPYYTDKDRERAAARRKLNSQFRQLRQSPEDAYDIFGISVPKVTSKPTLDDYGLSHDIEERLNFADEEYIRNEKSVRKTIALIVTVVVIGLFIFVSGQMNETNHPENYSNGQLTNTALGWSMAILSIGGFFGGFALWAWAFDVKPKQTYEHTQFDKYKTQLRHYEYWQRRKQKDYWNGMGGHQFEGAVANLFRNIGFTAEVSKRGGDGGIDIVLQKAGRKIAVQCKRYKSNVGPHTIRDLWGTMHNLGYDEGCIVTTTGFTKGVTSFAHDKNIFLIDLNDILRSIGENGDEYLRKQIGE